MKVSTIQIALDFVECTKEQKQIFLSQLESMNWKSINPNKLWEIHFSDNENNLENIRKIEQELMIAKELSSLYELDYAIIADEEIYFNQLT